MNFSPNCFRLASCLAFSLTLTELAATVQNPQFPSPIATELVFPSVLFGQSGPVRIETLFRITNATESEAYVRIDLFSSDGQPASLHFHKEDGPRIVFYKLLIPPRSAHVLTYNGEDRLLVPSLFEGWGMLRANRTVSAGLSLRVYDQRTDEKTSEVTLVGTPARLNRARFPVLMGSAEHQSGLAVVAAGGSSESTIQVQLLDRLALFDAPDSAQLVAEQSLTLPANGQILFPAGKLFPGKTGDFVQFLSEHSFAAAVLRFSFLSHSGQLALSHPRAFDLAGNPNSEFQAAGPWNFSAGLGPPQTVGPTLLTPSEFGLYLERPTDYTPQFYPFAEPRIFVEPDLEIAVAGDLRAKIIVFGDGVVLEEILPGHDLAIRILEDGIIEIEAVFSVDVGLVGFAHKLLLIDPQTRVIIDRFTGSVEQDPPWRN